MKLIRASLAGLLLLMAATPAIAQEAVHEINQYPGGATAVECSAVGTTAATSCALPATAGVTNFVCGFSIIANATAAATGNATLVGPAVTLNFTQWTAINSGPAVPLQPLDGSPCIPASAQNTAITVTSAAPGAGGVVSVSAWGYQK